MTIDGIDMRLNLKYVGIIALIGLAIILFLAGPVAAESHGQVQPVDLYDAWFQDVNSFLPASFQIMFNGQ